VILPCESLCENFDPKFAKGWEISHHMKNLEQVISTTWLVVRMVRSQGKLIRNQQVAGSNPIAGFSKKIKVMHAFLVGPPFFVSSIFLASLERPADSLATNE